MHIDLSTVSVGARYALMTQTLIPRPVAWVLSENANGTYNLAPFSYFTPIGSQPPMIALSVGNRPEGGPKDTAANIATRDPFVVHIGHRELLGALNDSSASLPPGVSEVDALGLATTPIPGFPLPRLADARIALACRRHTILEVGDAPQHLILGVVTSLYVDDTCVTKDGRGRLTIDAAAVDPIARLGSRQYALLGEIVNLDRPR